MKNKDLYDKLGVNKTASDDEIKKAFREKAKDAHPDKQGGDHQKMQELTQAYGILKDPLKRAKYDNTGEMHDVPFDQKFTGFVASIFLKLIEVNGDGVDRVDLIAEFLEQCRLIIENSNKEKAKLNKERNRIEKVMKRLSSTKENKIGRVLEFRITEYKKDLRILDDQIQFMRDCEEVIGHHSYQFDPLEPKEDENGFAWITMRSTTI